VSLASLSSTGGVDVFLQAFLTTALHRGEGSATIPGRFTPDVRRSCTYWIGVLLGCRVLFFLWKCWLN